MPGYSYQLVVQANSQLVTDGYRASLANTNSEGLSNYAANVYSDQIGQLDKKVTFIVDYLCFREHAKADGYTAPEHWDRRVADNAVVFINPNIKGSALEVAVGHELVHALHFTNGWYAGWSKSYSDIGAHNISEYWSYNYSTSLEIQVGINGGGALYLGYYLNNLPNGYNK